MKNIDVKVKKELEEYLTRQQNANVDELLLDALAEPLARAEMNGCQKVESGSTVNCFILVVTYDDHKEISVIESNGMNKYRITTSNISLFNNQEDCAKIVAQSKTEYYDFVESAQEPIELIDSTKIITFDQVKQRTSEETHDIYVVKGFSNTNLTSYCEKTFDRNSQHTYRISAEDYFNHIDRPITTTRVPNSVGEKCFDHIENRRLYGGKYVISSSMDYGEIPVEKLGFLDFDSTDLQIKGNTIPLGRDSLRILNTNGNYVGNYRYDNETVPEILNKLKLANK